MVSAQNAISLKDFFFLNPEIDANCTNLLLGVAYCIDPVGTISTYANYSGSVPRTGACASAFAPSTCLIDMATFTSVPFLEANATFNAGPSTTGPTRTPSPTASGTVAGCAAYAEYYVSTDAATEASINKCSGVAAYWGSTIQDLLTWNPSLSSTNCAFQKGFSYCVLFSDGNISSSPALGTQKLTYHLQQ